MNTLNLQFTFRPIKFGWCIRKDNFEALRKAIMLSYTLWGGRYNPIIVIDEKGSEKIVDSFKVDALYPISNDQKLKDFTAKFKYLIWPSVHDHFFLTDSPKKYSNYVDLYHPINLLYKEYVKNIHEPKIKISLIEWNNDDPLADILLATVGKTEVNDYIAKDYLATIKNVLPFESILINKSDPIASNLLELNTINFLSSYGLFSRWGASGKAGFYYGNSNSFSDIVNYWNLRACNIDILFYDKNHTERLENIKNEFVEVLEKRLEKQSFKLYDGIFIWNGTDTVEDINNTFKTKTRLEPVWEHTWGSIESPPLNTGYKNALGTVEENSDKTSVTFQLPDNLFSEEEYEFTQYLIVSLNILSDIDNRQDKEYTFFIPNLPELNEFLARKCFTNYSRLRMDNEGINLIVNVSAQTITLYALRKNELFSKIFETYGYLSKVTVPSLKAGRIIKQMHGIQGCRVFKIRGVRELLDKIKPADSFQSTHALNIIGQMDTSNKPQFSDFEDLYIERREKRKLAPHDVLKYLTEKGVFRVGLKLECPNCQLEPWLHLDQLKTVSICEYCGYEFNITKQLRDRNWFYRPSSLFSSKDAQSGIIPVILTLQQLDTTILGAFKTFSTGLEVKSKANPKFKCDIDLIHLSQPHYSKLQLAIGECKTKYEITVDDVQNLIAVADSLPADRLDVFIIFSKLTAFSKKEIELCKNAQIEYRNRVILLTDRELEPYNILEKTRKEFDIKISAISLEDLARITYDIYFRTNE